MSNLVHTQNIRDSENEMAVSIYVTLVLKICKKFERK